MRTLATFFCLLPWLTLAQVPIMPGGAVPWFRLTSTGSPLPQYTNIYVDLDDGTLALGAASSWTDSVHGIIFTNTLRSPTKTSDGLKFYNTNFLRVNGTVAAGSLNTNDAFFMVVRNIHGGPTVWKTVVGVGNAESGVMLKGTYWSGLFNSYDMALSSSMSSNYWYDIVYCGGTNKVCWTNGVFSADKTTGTKPGSWVWNTVGANQAAGSDFWYGEIRKIVWWTNSHVGGGLSTNEALALHSWATNKYGYSP